MNDSELELVIDLATAGERYTPEQYAATKTAEAELAAMRQPITGEALIADDWTQNNRQFQKRNGIFVYPFNDPPIVAIRNKRAKGVETMRDLRELERLISGAR